MFKVGELVKASAGRLRAGSQTDVVQGVSIDTRKILRREAFIAVKGKNFDGHNFISQAIKKGASCVICEDKATQWLKSRAAIIQVKDTVKALGDIAGFHRERFDVPVIAVTGSNGKTTAKEMIFAVLSKKYNVLKNEGTRNNQIGVPNTLLRLRKNHGIAVLELGTNHPGEIGYLAKICRPNIGIITNIAASHLEAFFSLQGVLKEKYALIKSLKEPNIGILNSDDALLKKQTAKALLRPMLFSIGIDSHADFRAGLIRLDATGLRFNINGHDFSLKSHGAHNVYNALIAVAVGRIFGLSFAQASAALADFKFPPGRFRQIKRNKVRFIDDTYNSNPFSLKKALEAYERMQVRGRKIFVMGDMLELGLDKERFHAQAGADIGRICDVFISVGELSRLAAKLAASNGIDPENIFACSSARKVRDLLRKKLSVDKDDVVLVKGSRGIRMEEILK